MALVPADFINSPCVKASDVQLTQLDQEMKKILDNRSIDPEIKFKLYNQVLREHHEIKAHSQKPMEIPILKMGEEKEKKTNANLPSEDTFLTGIPMKKKANTKILHKFLRNSNEIKWNELGELVVNDEPIDGSNATSLFHYAIRDLTKWNPLTGWTEFLNLLHANNVPREGLSNINLSPSSPSLPGTSRYSTPSPVPTTKQCGCGFKWLSLYK